MLVERHVCAFLVFGRSLTPPNADAPPAVVSKAEPGLKSAWPSAPGRSRLPREASRLGFGDAAGEINASPRGLPLCRRAALGLPAAARQEETPMRAFIFPGPGEPVGRHGQGAGRGEPASPARLFEEVDEALGQKLSRLMAEGPQRRADPHRERPAGDHGQCGRDLARLGHRSIDKADFVAGHSLGEYTRAVRRRRVRPRRPPRGCSSCAARRCRRRCRSGEGAMAALLGAERRHRPGGRRGGGAGRGLHRRQRQRSRRRSSSPAIAARSSARSRSPRRKAPSARSCCRSRRPSTAR